jgi:hypothetical protein
LHVGFDNKSPYFFNVLTRSCVDKNEETYPGTNRTIHFIGDRKAILIT